jgi:hypothetical protein
MRRTRIKIFDIISVKDAIVVAVALVESPEGEP